MMEYKDQQVGDLIVEFDKDLRKQTIYANPDWLMTKGVFTDSGDPHKLLQLDDPLLTLDPIRLGQTQEGNIALELFGSIPTTIIYDGLPNLWDPQTYQGTWPVSIDTMLTAQAMKNHLQFPNVKSILDLGCGTGFLGIYAQSKGIQHGVYSDLNPHAIRATEKNLALLNDRKFDVVENSYQITVKSKLGTHQFFNGDSYNALSPLTNLVDIPLFDLIVLGAPPYLPLPPGRHYERPSTFEGTDLLQSGLKQGKEWLTKDGKLLVSYGITAQEEVESALESANASLKILAEKDVPLRIRALTSDVEWREYLLTKGLKHSPEKGYEYWNRFRVGVVTYN